MDATSPKFSLHKPLWSLEEKIQQVHAESIATVSRKLEKVVVEDVLRWMRQCIIRNVCGVFKQCARVLICKQDKMHLQRVEEAVEDVSRGEKSGGQVQLKLMRRKRRPQGVIDQW